MRLVQHLQRPLFTVDHIDIQNVARKKNYRHSYRTGRIKHGFIYTVSGSISYSFLRGEEKIISASAGEMMFIPQGCAYTATYLESNTEIKIVQFELASGELPSYLASPRKIELPDSHELMDAFFDHGHSRATDHPFYYLSCLYGMLWQLDETHTKLPLKHKKLQAALHDLSEHYTQNHTIAYYAELCGMSEVHFRRVFREYTGKSPIEYRNDLRLENADKMLRGGDYNVSEAAEASGFSNLSFFIRLYKKKFGHTPAKP